MTRRRWETATILCLFVWFCCDHNFVVLNYIFFLYAKHGGIVLRHKVQFTYRLIKRVMAMYVWLLTKRVMARYVMSTHTSYLSLSFHRKRLIVLICANTYVIQLLVICLLENGRWIEEESVILVPGDIISVNLGDIIPTDAHLLWRGSTKNRSGNANWSCSSLCELGWC